MTNEIPDGPWTLAQGECDGKPMLLRINGGAAALAGNGRFGQRVDVAIPLRAPNADGLPRPEEALQIGAIEDQLVSALTAGAAGVFVLAITTGGAAELVFYSADGAASAAQIEALAPAIGSHALQHLVEHDPEWDVFHEFAEALDSGSSS